DVHRLAGGEVADAATPLRGAGDTDAAPVRFPLRALRVRAAYGAAVRKLVCRQIAPSRLGHHANDFRDNVAGPLNDHLVTDADVLPSDLILVMERGPGYHHPRHLDRFHDRYRRQLARAANLDDDVQNTRRGLLRGVLIGERPARASGDAAQLGLSRRGIDLDHDAIGVEGKLPAAVRPRFAELYHRGDVRAKARLRARGKAPLSQRLKQIPLRRRPPAVRGADSVADEPQVPACRDRGV